MQDGIEPSEHRFEVEGTVAYFAVIAGTVAAAKGHEGVRTAQLCNELRGACPDVIVFGVVHERWTRDHFCPAMQAERSETSEVLDWSIGSMDELSSA